MHSRQQQPDFLIRKVSGMLPPHVVQAFFETWKVWSLGCCFSANPTLRKVQVVLNNKEIVNPTPSWHN